MREGTRGEGCRVADPSENGSTVDGAGVGGTGDRRTGRDSPSPVTPRGRPDRSESLWLGPGSTPSVSTSVSLRSCLCVSLGFWVSLCLRPGLRRCFCWCRCRRRTFLWGSECWKNTRRVPTSLLPSTPTRGDKMSNPLTPDLSPSLNGF